MLRSKGVGECTVHDRVHQAVEKALDDTRHEPGRFVVAALGDPIATHAVDEQAHAVICRLAKVRRA
jgi:hypothetical protein